MTEQVAAPQSGLSDTPALQSQDVLAGLGAAPRELLATCIALFEDSTLQQRLLERVNDVKTKLLDKPAQGETSPNATVTSLQKRIAGLVASPVTDVELRLLVWMRVRDAFDLPASTFGSLRSSRTAADDLAAAVMGSLQLAWHEKVLGAFGGTVRQVPDSLDALARKTLEELVASAMQTPAGGDPAVGEALIRDMKARVAQLEPEAQDRLLASIGA